MTTVTIADGRRIELLDLDAVTPQQGLDLATAIADFLIRSGQIKDDVALSGPHLLQFLSEAADMAAQQAADAKATEEGRVIIKGHADVYSSKCFKRYVEVAVTEPYVHKVDLIINAKPGQSDDDLNTALEILDDQVAISAIAVDGDLVCTIDDITRLRP